MSLDKKVDTRDFFRTRVVYLNRGEYVSYNRKGKPIDHSPQYEELMARVRTSMKPLDKN